MIEAAEIEPGTERRAMGGLIGGALLASLFMFMVLLLPEWKRMHALDRDMTTIDARLRKVAADRSDLDTLQRLINARTEHRQLVHDRDTLRTRFHTFQQGAPISTPRGSEGEGRIDFKVALLEAREHLQGADGASGMELPENLGMVETIGTTERADSRLWQLMTVVKLVEQVRDAGIRKVIGLKPLAPLSYPVVEGDPLVTREFPIKITLECNYAQLADWLRGMREPGSFFTLRRFHSENISDRPGALLKVVAVCGGGLIRARPSDEPPSTGMEKPAVEAGLEPEPEALTVETPVASGEAEAGITEEAP